MRDTLALFGVIFLLLLLTSLTWFFVSYSSFEKAVINGMESAHASVFKASLNDEIKRQSLPTTTPIYLLAPPTSTPR